MGRKFCVAVIICMILLLLLAIAITGCSTPILNNDGNSTAISIAIKDPDVASELKSSNNDYRATASPADPAIHGYYNYSGKFYDVTIDTANLGIGGSPKNYLGHYKVLVDVDQKQVMAIQYSYDVATMPWQIILPAGSTWYQRLIPSGMLPNGMKGTYIELNLDALNKSINPVVIDYENSIMMKDGRPHMAFWFSDLGKNATTIDIGGSHPPLKTFLYNVTVIPGRLPIIGNNINGSGISFTFHDPGRAYYLMLVNRGPTDATVDVMVQ